jgi:hypothetical protein
MSFAPSYNHNGEMKEQDGSMISQTSGVNQLRRKPETIDEFYAMHLEELNNKIVETIQKRYRARNLGISHLAQADVRDLLDHYPF